MLIENATVLVTGANRGIGAEFVRQLLHRGARKVYATARNLESIPNTGAEKIALDVTDEAQVRELAARAGDVTLLINNAGVSSGADLLDGELDAIRGELETNLFGPLHLTRAFAPIFAANGGGGILNVLSAAAWFSAPGATSYALSKAAAWSLTDATRVQLASQGTQVTGLLMALVDTDMTAAVDAPKSSPSAIVTAALDGFEAGAHEITADDLTAGIKAQLHREPAVRYGDLIAPVRTMQG
ncbi:SDR family oxidoreductase [Microbacterium sp. NPDC089987]|uniref:SDR family oxidoreductase n=1 Tax=Microbacterium sp. NPDC089987 TaxID=3364202 RepID=UPI0037F6F1D1